MNTLTDLTRLVEFDFDVHLEMDDPIPVITGPQAQGDVYVLPVVDTPSGVDGVYPANGVPRPLGDGFDVIEGQGDRNAHTIRSFDPGVTVIPGTAGYPFDVVTLHVPEDETAFLLHREHGANAIGAGTYVLRCQRTQRAEIEQVRD